MPKTTKKLVVSKFADEGNHEPVFNHQFNEVTMNLKSNPSKGNKKVFAKFSTIQNDQQKILHLEGKNAETLIVLIEIKEGITTLQSHDFKLLRLSSYIHILRHVHDIKILTIREGERKIARYVLVDWVELLKSSISEVGCVA